jgi:hypothetical protein
MRAILLPTATETPCSSVRAWGAWCLSKPEVLWVGVPFLLLHTAFQRLTLLLRVVFSNYFVRLLALSQRQQHYFLPGVLLGGRGRGEDVEEECFGLACRSHQGTNFLPRPLCKESLHLTLTLFSHQRRRRQQQKGTNVTARQNASAERSRDDDLLLPCRKPTTLLLRHAQYTQPIHTQGRSHARQRGLPVPVRDLSCRGRQEKGAQGKGRHER